MGRAVHGRAARRWTEGCPAWIVTIDLKDAPREAIGFPVVRQMDDEHASIDCRLADRVFRGAGGSHMLEAIIEASVRWAGDARPGTA